MFLQELADWGLLLDRSMEILPDPERRTLYNESPIRNVFYLPSMLTARFRISEENVRAMAERLAIDHTAGSTAGNWFGGGNGSYGIVNSMTDGEWVAKGTQPASSSAKLYCISQQP